MCMLIAKFSSQAHELMLQFYSGFDSVCARCSFNRSRLSAPPRFLGPPASCRRAREKARLRSASARHSAVGCRCAPRPGAVPLGSGATNQDPAWPSASVPATIRSNSRLVARSLHPMHVRTGPSARAEMSSCGTTGNHSTGVEALFRTGKVLPPRNLGIMASFVEDFDGPELDTSVWLPHYLPAWSSREQTRASCRLENSCLVLDVPPGLGTWCPDDHRPPLRPATGVPVAADAGRLRLPGVVHRRRRPARARARRRPGQQRLRLTQEVRWAGRPAPRRT